MKLGPSILAIATVATRDCDLANYQSKVNFYGCITKRKLSVDFLKVFVIQIVCRTVRLVLHVHFNARSSYYA